MIEEGADILGHERAVVGGRLVKLGRLAMAAIVEGDDTASGARERCHPAGKNPIHLLGGGKAVHEHDWLALAFVEKGDFHPVMREARHAVTLPPARMLCISRRPKSPGPNAIYGLNCGLNSDS